MEKRLIMKRILPGIITTLIICSFISGQRSKRNKSLSNVGSYSLLEFSRAISKDSILVTAFVDIPFRSLQFIKKNNSFFASYDVSIILKNNKSPLFVINFLPRMIVIVRNRLELILATSWFT